MYFSKEFGQESPFQEREPSYEEDRETMELESKYSNKQKTYRNPKSSHFEKVVKDIEVTQTMADNMTAEHLAKLISAPLEEITLILNKFLKNSDSGFLPKNITELVLSAYESRLSIEDGLQKERRARCPVVTIMGHVDHGKTTLLDAYRNSNIAEFEHGRITQKIGAFRVDTGSDGKFITYIDTPGHHVFSGMRRRGASVTDLIVLVVSATDGVQQQTKEVLEIASQEKVPIIIAINKIDLEGADPSATEEELAKNGIELEINGGNIPVVHISAKARMNLDMLQELIVFESEVLNNHENFSTLNADGVVLESKQKEADGKSCTVIIQRGTLKVGSFVVIGNLSGKVKQIQNDKGEFINSASVSEAVEIVVLFLFKLNEEIDRAEGKPRGWGSCDGIRKRRVRTPSRCFEGNDPRVPRC